jgi:hypothetical protein
MIKKFLPLVLLCFVNTISSQSVHLDPVNPHYFEYKSKPVILITSAEHYGALINLDFDYIRYFDVLNEQGMNLSRVFSGTYIEREADIGWMLYKNTLAPRPNRLIVPWSRSSIPGYSGGGNKFDLDTWDENYFIRLKDLISQARSRGIIIEFTLFGNQYNDSTWSYSPLYPLNNIQNAGPSGPKKFLVFQTLSNRKLLLYQESFVRKIVTELNPFENVYYEISNEPYNDVSDTAAVDLWNYSMVKLIKETETKLPNKHLVATCFSIMDNYDVSVANFHYVHVPKMQSFRWLLSLNKVISMDETLGSVIHSNVNDTRVEAWDHILHGGGAYNNLSWEYVPGKEAGTDSARIIRQYLQILQKFMGGFDYIHMVPDNSIILVKPETSSVRVLSESGKQYAIYLSHRTLNGPGEGEIWGYHAMTDTFKDTLVINIPVGTYKVRWLNTSTGSFFEGTDRILNHKGGKMQLATPSFVSDIALQIKKI